MHSHIIVKGCWLVCISVKKPASLWQCGWLHLCNENENDFHFALPSVCTIVG